GVLVVGLGLAHLSRPPKKQAAAVSFTFFIALALLSLGMATLWLLLPTVLAAILFGGQIGGIVLLCWLAVEWLLRERYRRQVVFLPSFSRARKGSSLVRKPPSQVRPRGEPSTVDAPPPGS